MTGIVYCEFCKAEIVRYLGVSKVHFCDTKCKSSWQKLAKPATKEWLEKQYIELGRNCTEIAHEVGRDPKSVWNWMKDFGIQMRKRGTTGNHKFSTPRRGHTISEAHKEAVRQARKRDGRIPALINGVHWTKALGRRSANWKGGLTPERQAFYSTPEWAECVKAVWKRDDAKCQRCGLDSRTVLRGVIPFHIHHVDSFMIRERRAVVDNLALMCQHCHKWVHSKKNKKGVFLGKGH